MVVPTPTTMQSGPSIMTQKKWAWDLLGVIIFTTTQDPITMMGSTSLTSRKITMNLEKLLRRRVLATTSVALEGTTGTNLLSRKPELCTSNNMNLSCQKEAALLGDHMNLTKEGRGGTITRYPQSSLLSLDAIIKWLIKGDYASLQD